MVACQNGHKTGRFPSGDCIQCVRDRVKRQRREGKRRGQRYIKAPQRA